MQSPDRLSKRVNWLIVAASLFAAGTVIGIRQIGLLQRWELSAYDFLVRSTPKTALDSRLLIVAIDEATIQQQQQWPLSDQVIADAIQALQQHQPQAIGLDLYRDVPQLPGRDALLQELAADNIVAIRPLQSSVPTPINLPDTRVGFNDILIDPDNVVRRNLMYVQTARKDYLSFALRLSLQYLNHPTVELSSHLMTVNNTEFPVLEAQAGGYVLEREETAGWQVLLTYPNQDVAPHVSLNDILAGNYNPAWVKGKIVLIGTTAPSGKDLFLTPFSPGEEETNLMPGVTVHAQMVSQILSTVLDERPLRGYWPE